MNKRIFVRNSIPIFCGISSLLFLLSFTDSDSNCGGIPVVQLYSIVGKATTNIKDDIKQKRNANHRFTLKPSSFIELEFDFSVIREALNQPGFVKFRFTPYHLEANDDVRLYCRKRNTNDNNAGARGNMGDPIHIPNDGRGTDPAAVPDAIRYPNLVLTKKDIIEFLNNVGHRNFNVVRLVPFIKDPSHSSQDFGQLRLVQTYNSYRVFFDTRNTGIELNPSPPG